jgi:proteasome lid subunit RPN8/RPN11
MKYKQWTISRSVAAQTEAAFRSGNHEVFVVWPAPKSAVIAGVADVTRCIVPQQEPGVSPEGGVYVHIEGSELQRIQIDNFRRGERSIVQLHTHPGHDVRMSQLDREWEVVRHVGALSIIVPHYGRLGLLLGGGANVYEREEDDWRLWSDAEVLDRLEVV